MTTGVVPRRGLVMTTDHVVSDAPVAATDWSAICNAYDYLDGMGSALLPMCSPMQALNAIPLITDTGVTSLEPIVRCWPRYQPTHRVWFFVIAPDKSGGSITPGAAPFVGRYRFDDPSGHHHYGTFGDLPQLRQAIEKIETPSSRTSSETTLSPFISVDSDAYLVQLGCFELPRPSLAVGSSLLATQDGGVDQGIAGSGLPIADDYLGSGVGFIPREMAQLRDSCRHTGLFFGTPYATNTLTSTWTTVFASPPIVQERLLYNGQTFGTMEIAFYAHVSGAAASGDVRITMASGATVTVNVTATSSTLHRTSLPIYCTDFNKQYGRNSDTDDTVTVEIIRNDGKGAMNLYTITGGTGAPSAASVAAADALSVTRPRVPFRRGPLPPFMADRRRS